MDRVMEMQIEEERRRHAETTKARASSMPNRNQMADGGSMAMENECASSASPTPSRSTLTLDNVDEAFRYQPWQQYQQETGDMVREALVAAAKAILRVVPESPSRTRALNCLTDARMLANQAITFNGRF